jgi:hypothetical protein
MEYFDRLCVYLQMAVAATARPVTIANSSNNESQVGSDRPLRRVDGTTLCSGRPGFISGARDRGFHYFHQSPMADTAIASFHVLLNLLFTNHHTIRRYIA